MGLRQVIAGLWFQRSPVQIRLSTLQDFLTRVDLNPVADAGFVLRSAENGVGILSRFGIIGVVLIGFEVSINKLF